MALTKGMARRLTMQVKSKKQYSTAGTGGASQASCSAPACCSPGSTQGTWLEERVMYADRCRRRNLGYGTQETTPTRLLRNLAQLRCETGGAWKVFLPFLFFRYSM